MNPSVSVLIVGAGPTGLAHAIWLVSQGVSVRIVDRSAGPGETSRAMAVQARTLELYRQVGLADTVVGQGHPNLALNVWAGGQRKARVAMAEAGHSVTPYPFILTYPQDQHERVLIDKLQALGVRVERQTEFVSFEEDAGAVRSRLRKADGSEQVCTSTFLSACDGAKSPIRHQIGAGFEGGTYRQLFTWPTSRSAGWSRPVKFISRWTAPTLSR